MWLLFSWWCWYAFLSVEVAFSRFCISSARLRVDKSIDRMWNATRRCARVHRRLAKTISPGVRHADLVNNTRVHSSTERWVFFSFFLPRRSRWVSPRFTDASRRPGSHYVGMRHLKSPLVAGGDGRDERGAAEPRRETGKQSAGVWVVARREIAVWASGLESCGFVKQMDEEFIPLVVHVCC